ncbi:DUF2490 domain-containing protein [Lewinella sp. W8]|uniref:DUF2490 domain-containing protein n=1 Tax=Lewinella sp. W8 TaxID=2528208 RepID=UPI0015631ACD|nr:DUF2490 domain-containing protein [Lewinella sp. W8]
MPQVTQAQSQSAQTALWSGLAVEKEVNSRWAYQGEIEWRSNLETGAIPTYLFNLSTSWEAIPGGNISPGIRYEVDDDGGGAEIRLLTDLNYSRPFGQSRFGYENRIRVQRDILLDGGDPQTAFRIRPGAYFSPAGNWKITLESELRYRFDLGYVNRMRYTVALDHDFSEALALDLFFRIEDRYVENALTRSQNIIGIYLAYHLPNGKEQDFPPRRPFGRQYN